MKRDREKLILFPHQYWRLSRLLVPLILQKERKKYLVSFVKEADSISSYCDKKEYFFAQSNWAWEYCSQSFHLKAHHQMLSLQTFLSRKGPYTQRNRVCDWPYFAGSKRFVDPSVFLIPRKPPIGSSFPFGFWASLLLFPWLFSTNSPTPKIYQASNPSVHLTKSHTKSCGPMAPEPVLKVSPLMKTSWKTMTFTCWSCFSTNTSFP